mmetsp:Transcript_32895/g.27841  ORF Transcript_32895/g.27841 Transcript_32895/m.27841 type:complete len:174 (+) Transcript_32895:1895-2416(+)
MDEKHTQQNDQLQLMREKLRKKEDELSSSKHNFNSKLDTIKSKFNEEVQMIKSELEDKSQKVSRLDKEYRKLENISHFEKNSLQTKTEELQDRIEELNKELATVNSNQPEPQVRSVDSAELLAKLTKLEQELQFVTDAEAALRHKTRDLERQVEVEGNNARLLQDQYSSLKQM